MSDTLNAVFRYGALLNAYLFQCFFDAQLYGWVQSGLGGQVAQRCLGPPVAEVYERIDQG